MSLIDDFTIDEGESGTLFADIEDKAGNLLDKAQVKSLTIEINDASTGTSIRSEQSILDINNGSLADPAVLTFKLQTTDTVNTASPAGVLEIKEVIVRWTWDDLDVEEQTGVHVFPYYVRTHTDNTPSTGASAPTLPGGEQLTSIGEMQRVFSTEGVNNHTEDVFGDQTVINELVYRATETVLQFLRGRYAIADMATSYWVRMKATYIACYYLSIRQGNPSLYGDMYNESMLDLAQARDGIINPGLATPARAIVQTPMLDSRFYQPARVRPQRSTKIYSGQNLPYRLGLYD